MIFMWKGWYIVRNLSVLIFEKWICRNRYMSISREQELLWKIRKILSEAVENRLRKQRLILHIWKMGPALVKQKVQQF